MNMTRIMSNHYDKLIEKKITLAKRVMIQRDLNIPEDKTIKEVLLEDLPQWKPENASNTVMVLGFSGNMFELNLIGALIFEHIEENHDVKTLINFLSEYFNKNPIEIEKDIIEFINDALKSGLILEKK